MLGNAVLGHRKGLPDHAYLQLAGLSEQRDDLAARRIGQTMKHAAEPLLLASLPRRALIPIPSHCWQTGLLTCPLRLRYKTDRLSNYLVENYLGPGAMS